MGVKQDFSEAAHWFKEAIKNNHAFSEFYLGLCYLHGHGVPQNEEIARTCFRKAVKQGYEEAVKYLR